MDYETASYLCHHGVKGMKWGVRKDKNRVSTSRTDRKIARIDKRIAKNEARINKLSSKKHGTARYADIHSLKMINDVERARKTELSKKQAYKDAKQSGKGVKRAKQQYKNAKNYRQLQSIDRRNSIIRTKMVNDLGYGKSARGSYYRSREKGRGRVNSALRATGKQTAINLAVAAGTSALVAGGKYAVNSYLKKKVGNGSTLASLPAHEILEAKHVKVRTIR